MEEKTGAVKNPSYDTSLPIKTRLRDFLGKYHIILNGVVKHDPFDLKNEGKPGVRCDEDHKQEIVEFVDKALSQSKKDTAKEIFAKWVNTEKDYDFNLWLHEYVDSLKDKEEK